MITCTFENSGKATLRHVTVDAIIFNSKQQFLLVKRAPHLLNGNKFALVGGFLERDEDTKMAIVRETKEETGLDGTVEFLLRVNDNPKRPKEDRQNVDFIYVVRVEEKEFDNQSDEVSSLHWFVKEDLPSEEEFAFDHRENIQLYLQYLQNPFTLPKLG